MNSLSTIRHGCYKSRMAPGNIFAPGRNHKRSRFDNSWRWNGYGYQKSVAVRRTAAPDCEFARSDQAARQETAMGSIAIQFEDHGGRRQPYTLEQPQRRHQRVHVSAERWRRGAAVSQRLFRRIKSTRKISEGQGLYRCSRRG